MSLCIDEVAKERVEGEGIHVEIENTYGCDAILRTVDHCQCYDSPFRSSVIVSTACESFFFSELEQDGKLRKGKRREGGHPHLDIPHF